MKKMSTFLCFCLITTPLAFADMPPKHKKNKHHHKVMSYKGEIPIVIEAKKEDEKKPEPANPWLNNLSGTMALTSNYVFRGISQTTNLPAIQGGLTYTFPLGIYLNVWGSNVKFAGSGATIEIDTIAGVSNKIGENFSYDINIDRYNYPSAQNLAYNELNSIFNFYFLQAGLSYSANVYNSHQSGTYYNGGINYDIPPCYIFGFENVNILALFGHYSLPRAAGNSYNDYNVALSKKIKNYTLMAQWTGTNGQAHNPPYDSNHLIGTISAEF